MSIEIKIPSVGESVQEAVLAEWFKQDGDTVHKDDPLFVIETDKVTLEVVAEANGVLKIMVKAGETVAIGAVVGSLEPVDTAVAPPEQPKAEAAPEPEKAPIPEPAAPEQKRAPAAQPAPSAAATPVPADGIPLPPSVRRLIAEKRLDASKIQGSGPGGRISKGDVLLYLENAPAGIPDAPSTPVDQPSTPAMEERKPMTPIRKRIAERLLASKQSTAMLTTFNEIDMARAMEIRSLYKEAFQKAAWCLIGIHVLFRQSLCGSSQGSARDQCLHRRQRYRLPQLPAHRCRRGHRRGAWWCR
jgi:2-oxoglutarate dehydrogenase E2 component (dihydrolipoamide succinyltransferase)